jgi:hypothetical protein
MTTDETANSLMREGYPFLQMIQPLREQVLAMLNDEDLAFALPGNPTLGVICRQMGDVQGAYVQSFRDFAMAHSYPASRPEAENSVQALRDWYQELDADMAAVLAGLTEADIHERQIQRPGFAIPLMGQLMAYREALFIFYGKASVYLQAIDKDIPQQWREWIG